jgi:hypothetical protein
MSNNQTFIVYEGPSLIDQSPIVVLVQIGSKNPKTGDMVQTYILCADADPVTANRTGQDRAICGDCVHRGKPNLSSDKGQALGRSCYVTLAHGPLGKFKAYKKGQYKYASGHADLASLGKGRMVRLGTYGDPAAVPFNIWKKLLEQASGHTGYTHQWRKFKSAKSLKLMSLVMASADSEADRIEAIARRFRTFRVRSSDEPIMAGEFQCPASKEAGKKKTCGDCMACDGGISRKGSPVIVVHGSLASRFSN